MKCVIYSRQTYQLAKKNTFGKFQEAAQRILKVEKSLGKKQNFSIFYESRNNIGLSFQAPIDADIGVSYFSVSTSAQAQQY